MFELGAAVACPRPCLCPVSSKEAYSHGKKDLSSSKETYSYGKKDLSTFKKRPIAPECPVMVVCIYACRYVYTYIRVCARACMHVCPVHGFARYVYKCACECEVCQYKRTHRHTDNRHMRRAAGQQNGEYRRILKEFSKVSVPLRVLYENTLYGLLRTCAWRPRERSSTCAANLQD